MADAKAGKTHSSPVRSVSIDQTVRPRVFFDIKIGDKDKGRIVFELVG